MPDYGRDAGLHGIGDTGGSEVACPVSALAGYDRRLTGTGLTPEHRGEQAE